MKRATQLLAVLALMLGSSQANAAFVVNWTGSGGASDFDNQAISFAPFVANQLTLISGQGISHNHSNPNVTFTIDAHVNGNWVTLTSWTQDSLDHLVSERTSGGPIAFAGGTIDGLRLTDTPLVSFAYHSMGETFTFDNVALNAVPAPAGLVLIATATPFAGYFGWRRRKQIATA